MIVANVANSGNDEFYTPDYAIDPIMKYIPEGSRIWCPFDTAESLFVKRFSGLLFGVILEICNPPIHVHNFKVVIPEHFKSFLALKKPHHPHKHSKRLSDVKKPLQHIPFQAVRRIADNVIAFRRLYQKEILAVENMCCGYEIPPENLLTNRLSAVSKGHH